MTVILKVPVARTSYKEDKVVYSVGTGLFNPARFVFAEELDSYAVDPDFGVLSGMPRTRLCLGNDTTMVALLTPDEVHQMLTSIPKEMMAF